MSTQIRGAYIPLESFPLAQAFAQGGTRAFLLTRAGAVEVPIVDITASQRPTLIPDPNGIVVINGERFRQGGLAGAVSVRFSVPSRLPPEWGFPGLFSGYILRPFDGTRSQTAGFRTTIRSVTIEELPPDPEDPPVGPPEFPTDACAPVPTVIEEVPVSSPCSSGAGGSAGPPSFF